MRGVLLPLRPSSYGRCISLLWIAGVCLAPTLVWERGYPVLAALLVVYSILCLSCRRAPQPAVLACRAGAWYLWFARSGWHPVTLGPGAVCLPWLVYLPWRAAGVGRGSLCLWPDSGAGAELRRLRRCLKLQG